MASRGRGEDLGQDLVHGVLEAFVLALATLLGNLPSPLQLGVVALVVGWLLGLAGVADLLADLVDEGANLLVGARLHLGLQLIDPLDERIDAWSSRSLESTKRFRKPSIGAHDRLRPASRAVGQGVGRGGDAPRRRPM